MADRAYLKRLSRELTDITNLDGDDLCQDCADAWARAEGDWQHYLEAEGAGDA